MARIRIIADNQTLMDSQVTLRSGELPSVDSLKDDFQKASGGRFETWQLSAITALSSTLLVANLNGAVPDTTITVTTRPDGWDMNLRQG